MDIRITPHTLEGSVGAIPSKSMAHRLLLLSGLCTGITDLDCPLASQDIEATLRSLQAIGAPAARTRTGFRMVPITMGGTRRSAKIDVGESGSTLRFMLPVVAALGKGATFTGQGRLAERPLAPLDEQLVQHGVALSATGTFPLEVSGRLTAGRFELPGNVSSQFVSGLLMAAPLLDGDTIVAVSEPVESQGYIRLTIDALNIFGVEVAQRREERGGTTYRTYAVSGDASLVTPGACTVEGDWSNAAFWLAAGSLSGAPISVSALNLQSHQGDRAIMAALALLGARIGRNAQTATAVRDRLQGRTIDVSGIPDLAAPLATCAAYAEGTTRLTNAGRLRFKESDRLATISEAIRSLGGYARVEGDDLVIEGRESLPGGTVDAAGDHRIAMMAAIIAAFAAGPTTIQGAECVAKSYPSFFDDFSSLGGIALAEEA